MTENDYKSLPDAPFRTQYDATPSDPEVDAVLRGIEPPRAPRQEGPRLSVIEPAPRFRWIGMKTLR